MVLTCYLVLFALPSVVSLHNTKILVWYYLTDSFAGSVFKIKVTSCSYGYPAYPAARVFAARHIRDCYVSSLETVMKFFTFPVGYGKTILVRIAHLS